MYYTLLLIHSILRWLVLLSLLLAVFTAMRGYMRRKTFTTTDNMIRHWTATIAHIQLVAGMMVYTQSPVVKSFFATDDATTEALFFGAIHIALMLCAIIVITVGSAIAKRTVRDGDKFRHVLLWYSLALLAIVVAIPWPFSPFAQRPLLRPF